MIAIKTLKIKLKINDFFIEKDGKLDKNILSFECNNIKYTFDMDNIILNRENEEFISKIDFFRKTDNCEYILKEINRKFYYNLTIKEFTKESNIVIIKYLMNEETFNLMLTWEE